MAHDIGMVEIFHDLNFLVDVLLEVGFLFDMNFADDFDRIKFIIVFFIKEDDYYFWRG